MLASKMKENIDKIVFIQEPMHFVFCSSASDRILRSYKRSLNGFAAKLSKEEADKLSGWCKTCSCFQSFSFVIVD